MSGGIGSMPTILSASFRSPWNRFGQGRQQLLFRGCKIVCQRYRAAGAHQCHCSQQGGGLIAGQRHGWLKITAGKPVAAFRTTLRIHRNAKRDQPVDVAIDRAMGNVKPFGKYGCRDKFAAGQQKQDAECAFNRVHGKSGSVRSEQKKS